MSRFLTVSLLVALAACAVPVLEGVSENGQTPDGAAAPLMHLLPARQKALHVNQAALRVHVAGSWAAQTLELELVNEGAQEVRDVLTFTLAPDSCVLGFSVERQNGDMCEAVPLPDQQPLAVAGEPERPKPGMARPGDVLPRFPCPVVVPPGEKRRVVFRYAQPMPEDEGGRRVLHLPRFAEGALPALSVDFLLTGRTLPLPLETPGGNVEFFPDEGALTGHADWEGPMLTHDVCLRFPPGASGAGVEEDGGIFYAAASWRLPEPPESEFPEPECVGLVWDASASMRGYDRGKALAFLRAYLQRAAGKTKNVRLTVLRHEAGPALDFPVRDGRAKELEEYLAGLADDGATGDLRAAVAALRPVGICFVYSDGRRTFGAISPENPGVPVYALLPEGEEFSAAWARVSAVPVDLSGGSATSLVESLRRCPYRLSSLTLDGRDWPGAVTTAYGGVAAGGEFCLSGILPEGRHVIEGILTSGDKALVLEEVCDTETAVCGIMLKARYAHLLARQAELQPDVPSRHRTLKSLNELYRVAVPGYHWGLPQESPGGGVASPQTSDVAGLAAEFRAWHGRTYEGRVFRARIKSVFKRVADGLEELEQSRSESSNSGEIATGKVPAWLREEDSTEAPGRKGKKRPAADDGLASAVFRRKVHLLPWRQEAPYLKELQRAGDPVRTYEKLCDRYARSPGFFVDCSYFFSQRNDRSMAVRAISNLAEIEPDYLPLQTALAMRLLQLEEFERARACWEHILEKKEDAFQVYWLLAYLEGRSGHLERAAEYLVRLVQVPGASDGLVQNALIELNRLRARAAEKGEPFREGLVDPAWVFEADADLRLVLLWDSFDSDIDLSVEDAAGERCDSESETTASGGWRSRDITLGLGAESFMVRRALSGGYEVSARVFGPREGAMFAPASLCLLTYQDYGRSGERATSHFFQLDRRNGGVLLDEVRYESADGEEQQNEGE